MEAYFFNKEVVVDAVYFQDQADLNGYPRHMVYDGQEVTFQSGLQRIIHKGGQIVRMFDMTDGSSQYELAFEPQNQAWKLQHVVAG
jgi:hypothetical protein